MNIRCIEWNHEYFSDGSIPYNSLRPIDPYISLNWVIIGSRNGLSTFRRQAITCTNFSLSIGTLGTKFSAIPIEIKTFSLTKLHLKMSSAKMGIILPQPQCINTSRLIFGSRHHNSLKTNWKSQYARWNRLRGCIKLIRLGALKWYLILVINTFHVASNVKHYLICALPSAFTKRKRRYDLKRSISILKFVFHNSLVLRLAFSNDL